MMLDVVCEASGIVGVAAQHDVYRDLYRIRRPIQFKDLNPIHIQHEHDIHLACGIYYY